MNMVTRMIVMVVVWIIDLIRYKTPTQSRKKEAVQHEVFTERVIGANDEHRTSVRDVTEYISLYFSSRLLRGIFKSSIRQGRLNTFTQSCRGNAI